VTAPRIGSLCTGYGGLDLAALALFGGELAWHAEVDPDACAVLARRFPGVPNLGDITTKNWKRVPRVDVLTAGYPCQPTSTAGRRKGEDDARWIWPHVLRAVRVLRPRTVLLENVAGHLSLGFGTVLGQLSACRFDAEWLVLAASDLGAAHQRKRLFVLAWPADPASQRRRQGPLPPLAPAQRGQPGHPPGQVAADPDRDRVRLQPVPDDRGERAPVAGLAGPVAAADPARVGEREPPDPHHPQPGRRQARALPGRGGLLPTPRATDGDKGGPNACNSDGTPKLSAAVQPQHWGRYAPAIARHEALTGRRAPEPTEPGPNGPRLSPRFPEWLMCLPDGWVTAVPGIGRSAQLRILGNGVIPSQAEAAARELARRATT
jgi:DNA (cytosine-5)-methyltransferase 1